MGRQSENLKKQMDSERIENINQDYNEIKEGSRSVRKIIIQIAVYILGLLLIAIGTNFAKMCGLGISPVNSIPRALEIIWGLSLGKTVIIIYCILVLLQLLILRKEFKIANILGIPVALVFGSLVDLVGINPDTFGHLLYNFPRPQNYIMSLCYLAFSIIVIGLGVAVYLKANLVPMPAEGLAKAISDKTGKAFGDCKTGVDVCLICGALIIQLIFLGGLSSFTGSSVVVREGTVLSALMVGQVVKFVNKHF